MDSRYAKSQSRRDVDFRADTRKSRRARHHRHSDSDSYFGQSGDSSSECEPRHFLHFTRKEEFFRNEDSRTRRYATHHNSRHAHKSAKRTRADSSRRRGDSSKTKSRRRNDSRADRHGKQSHYDHNTSSLQSRDVYQKFSRGPDNHSSRSRKVKQHKNPTRRFHFEQGHARQLQHGGPTSRGNRPDCFSSVQLPLPQSPDFWEHAINFLCQHRSCPELNNATHSMMCGGMPLPFVVGSRGHPVRLPPMLAFDTPEKRAALRGLVAAIYERNPRETLPLVEFGVRGASGGLFKYIEDIDILLKDGQLMELATRTEGAGFLTAQDIKKLENFCTENDGEDDAETIRGISAKVDAVMRTVEKKTLRSLMPARVRSLKGLWDEDHRNMGKACTELLVFSSSGYAVRYRQWKISLHLIWPELRVGEEVSVRIRERLMNDLERSHDRGVDWFKKCFFHPDTQQSFEDIFDKSCVRGASLRMAYCDKFTRKDRDDKEFNKVEGRPKIPIYHCKIDFLAMDRDDKQCLESLTPAEEKFTPIQWLEHSQVALLEGKDGAPLTPSNILAQHHSPSMAPLGAPPPTNKGRGRARARTTRGSGGGKGKKRKPGKGGAAGQQRAPVVLTPAPGARNRSVYGIGNGSAASSTSGVLGANAYFSGGGTGTYASSKSNQAPSNPNLISLPSSRSPVPSVPSPGTADARPLAFERMLSKEDILEAWKPTNPVVKKERELLNSDTLHCGFVLHVDGSRDVFLNKVAVGVVLRFGHFVYVGDSNLEMLANGTHTVFQGGFLFRGQEIEGDHEAAAASVGLSVLRHYLENLKASLLASESSACNHLRKITTDELVRGNEICLVADSRVPMFALENKTKKLAAKQVQLLQKQRASLERDFTNPEAAARMLLRWVRRDNNKDADRCAKHALNEKAYWALPPEIEKLVLDSLT
ncbi:unnamed protein product [Amoebophrya sp. A25]|nr:unnamed protein product [Amoebophrya sp. A25]|eukprot:GSA25T00011970001.1